jgi:hypothetical protein
VHSSEDLLSRNGETSNWESSVTVCKSFLHHKIDRHNTHTYKSRNMRFDEKGEWREGGCETKINMLRSFSRFPSLHSKSFSLSSLFNCSRLYQFLFERHWRKRMTETPSQEFGLLRGSTSHRLNSHYGWHYLRVVHQDDKDVDNFCSSPRNQIVSMLSPLINSCLIPFSG